MRIKNEQRLPVAKVENIIIQELPEETLVYDLERHKAHCLNKTASFVWKRCDGRATVREITADLCVELDTKVDEKVVWLAIDQLEKSRLLQGKVARPRATANLSRRSVMKKIGIAATLLPIVTSLVAPTAIQAVTCTTGCANDAQCIAAPQGGVCPDCPAGGGICQPG
jgi:hypothetical protein